MRIIQFSDSFLPVMDGVGNVVYQYALNLAHKGHECYVVAPQTDTGYRGGYPFELVDYIGVPLPRMKSYKIGTREFTALDLPVILQRIRELAKTIEGLEGNMRTKRAVMVVPRDL